MSETPGDTPPSGPSTAPSDPSTPIAEEARGSSETPRPGPPGRRVPRGKDLLIGALAVALLAMTLFAFRGALGAAGSWLGGADGAAVEVFDVVLDREERRSVDLFFDQPVAEGRVGDVLAEAPATIDPPLAGVWRWRDANILRFEPVEPFPPASLYRISLIPERILGPGQRLGGSEEIEVRTDQFLLDGVDLSEEPLPEGRAQVFYRGTLRFNYPVDPEQLAPLVRLEDPTAGEPVEVILETGWWSSEIGFRTAAVQKRPEARTVTLVVDGALTPASGNVPLGTEVRHEIPVGSSEVLEVRRVEASPGLRESSLRITLSSPVTEGALARALTLEPAVRYRLSADRNVVTLVGDLSPGHRYLLKIASGLPATDGATLRQAFEQAVVLSDLPPSVEFESAGMFLARSGAHALAVETVNSGRFNLTVDRVYRNNLFSLFQYGGFDTDGVGGSGERLRRSLGDRLASRTFTVKGPRNQELRTVVDLDPWIEGSERGLYRVMVGRPGEWRTSERWLHLTDLGVVTKRGDGELLVWAASIRSLEPAVGARVSLISDQNQVIARGATDGSGLWRLEDDSLLVDGSGDRPRPYLLLVERGEDFTFLLFDAMEVDTTGLDVGGAPPAGQGVTAFLYGERDLYRPGETVEGVAVVRDGSLGAPAPMPAVLRHRDPQGREAGLYRLTTGAQGLAPFSVDLPGLAATGNHTFELQVAERIVGTWGVQVEEFVPDRIKVEIVSTTGAGEASSEDQVGAESLSSAAASPGTDLSWRVTSAYLFGPPAAGLPVETRVRLLAAPFAVPGSVRGLAGFSFENPERSFEDRQLFDQTGTLDDEGRAAFEASIPPGLEPPSSLVAEVTARVREQGGRGVAARTRIPVHPWSRYVGLKRLGEGYPEPGEEVTFEWVTVTPEGEEVPSEGLRLELYRDRWNTVLRRSPSGGFRYESSRDPELVESRSLAAGSSRGRVTLRPSDFGSHRAVATDPVTGASAAVEVFVSGWGTSPWALENPARVELDLDREEYRPGEVATVQVRSPFPGRLLLTVEGSKVHEVLVRSMEGNTATLEVPIRGEYRPNAYVTATLVRSVDDLEPGAVSRAFGAIPLPVDRTSNRLEPEIDAVGEIRSGKRLTATVTTAPGAAVTVAAVDEGILQLIAQETPDPFEHFYRQLALGVTSFDTFSLLMPEVSAASAGGGFAKEGAASSLRTQSLRRVEPVAFWSGVVTADGEGRAKVTFQLPEEFQGALRLMAVAIDGRRFGSSSATTRVRDPLVVLPTAPRVLSFEETLEIPVTVRNDTGRTGRFRVTLEVDGPLEDSGGARTLEVRDGAEATTYLAVTTGKRSGEARLRVIAEGNGERARSTVYLPVRPDLPPVALERAGRLTGAATRLDAPSLEGFRPATVERRLRLGALPLVQLSGKLDELLRYPYGCLEQTVAAAFPLVVLEDLAGALEPELLEAPKGDAGGSVALDGRGLSIARGDAAQGVQEAVRRLTLFQLWNGGFSLWPGGETAEPWPSLWATHFLVEARRAGHPVPEDLYQSALGHVAQLVTPQGGTPSTVQLQRSAYGLYVLARADRPEVGTMDFLRESVGGAGAGAASGGSSRGPQLDASSRALLAAAYATLGNPGATEELLSRLGDLERLDRRVGSAGQPGVAPHIHPNLGSPLRDRAVILLALLEADPDHPRIPSLVDRLAREVDRTWTTQESAWALLALGQLAREQREQPPASGRVLVAGEEVARFSGERPVTVALPARGVVEVRLDRAPGGSGEGGGQGGLFYSLLTRGVPTDEAFEASSQGLEVRRRILDREGRGVNLARVTQGDLLVLESRVRSVSGPLENVVLAQILPSGLEVENPRLETTETLPWASEANLLSPAYQDLRDDRILLFTSLPENTWQTVYTLVRAVAPGRFRLPPLHAEAMYAPSLRATGERGVLEISVP